MWCPNCRYEYKEGITQCADCHALLVEFDELPPEDDKSTEFDADFANWAGEHGEELAKIREQEQAKTDAIIEDSQPSGDIIEELTAFQSKSVRAAEYKSSAYTLLLVGTVGLIALILVVLGIIPLQLASNIKYISYGVMGVLFIIFIVTGIKCFSDYKRLYAEGKAEDDLTDNVSSWARETLSANSIDTQCAKASGFDAFDEIEKFYSRTECIKTLISDNFGYVEGKLLDKLAEDIYSMLYESDED